jgi:hypothetical protein
MLYFIRLTGLLLFAVFIFVGRLSISAVASEDLVINQVTDEPVSRLAILQASSGQTRINVQSTPNQVISQPVSYIRIIGDEPAVPKNLPPLSPIKPTSEPGNETCNLLHNTAAELFESKVTQIETPFTEAELGLNGLDCKLTALKNSADAEDYVAMAQDLKAMLAIQGWREDETYIAYGPNEMTLALEKSGHSGLLTVGWQATPKAACFDNPTPAPCVKGATQRLYHITFSYSLAPSPVGNEVTIIQDGNDY